MDKQWINNGKTMEKQWINNGENNGKNNEKNNEKKALYPVITRLLEIYGAV
jgi:hypothetical protein